MVQISASKLCCWQPSRGVWEEFSLHLSTDRKLVPLLPFSSASSFVCVVGKKKKLWAFIVRRSLEDVLADPSRFSTKLRH